MASNNHTNFSGSSNPSYDIVKHIVIDLKNEPEDLMDRMKWNIYRVPSNLRDLNEDAYTPQLVSIGPLHYGQEKLNPMQVQKLRYLKLFRGRVGNIKAMDMFKEYLTLKEDDIRQCYYAEKLYDIDKEKLVEMMLLDSVFIMELFLRIQSQKSEDNARKQTYSDDFILKQTWLNKSIQRDLLLLENQIPLFILEELYDTIFPDSDPDKKHPTFTELAHDYFDCFRTYQKGEFNNNISVSGFVKKFSSSSRFIKLKENWGNNEPQHFTDLIRSFYICKGLILHPRKKGLPLKTATKLQDAGVSFEKVIDRPLLDIKFQKVPILTWFLCLGCIPKFKMFEARVEIPQLTINHTTESVLSNIMALEQCHYPDQAYVCDYVSLFDSLMRTEEDIKLLVEKEVIVNTLRSDMEVETLVHGLGRNVLTNETCYKDIIDALDTYYKRKWWNRSMLELRLVYFRDLWRASSTIIGVVIFMFTVLNIYQAIRGFHVVKN